MSESRYTVAIVVDPMFGEQLAMLAERLHVWVVDTPPNRVVAERLWAAASGRHNLDRGVTTFRVNATESPEAWCAGILSAVDLHHGAYAHDPPYSAIEVYGTAPSMTLRAALASVDLSDVELIPGGFRAVSRPAG
jgi:hypothetical protein